MPQESRQAQVRGQSVTWKVPDWDIRLAGVGTVGLRPGVETLRTAGFSRIQPNNPAMSSRSSHPAPKKKLHQDWRIIVAAVVMMIAMIMYVLTMNETVVIDPMTPATPPAVPANP